MNRFIIQYIRQIHHIIWHLMVDMIWYLCRNNKLLSQHICYLTKSYLSNYDSTFAPAWSSSPSNFFLILTSNIVYYVSLWWHCWLMISFIDIVCSSEATHITNVVTILLTIGQKILTWQLPSSHMRPTIFS